MQINESRDSATPGDAGATDFVGFATGREKCARLPVGFATAQRHLSGQKSICTAYLRLRRAVGKECDRRHAVCKTLRGLLPFHSQLANGNSPLTVWLCNGYRRTDVGFAASMRTCT